MCFSVLTVITILSSINIILLALVNILWLIKIKTFKKTSMKICSLKTVCNDRCFDFRFSNYQIHPGKSKKAIKEVIWILTSIIALNWFRLSPASIYLLKVNNRNTRAGCEICSKLTIKTPERHQSRCSGVFIVNVEHISHLALVFLLFTLNR